MAKILKKAVVFVPMYIDKLRRVTDWFHQGTNCPELMARKTLLYVARDARFHIKHVTRIEILLRQMKTNV